MMAVRIEIFAKDQVSASQIVEYALSVGAVLQSYSEIEPPLKREVAKAPKAHGGSRAPYLQDVQIRCINSDNPFRKRSVRYRAAGVMAGFSTGTDIETVLESMDTVKGLDRPVARKVIKMMMEKGLVEIVT